MNIYNILDKLNELAAKDPHYADAAKSAAAMSGHKLLPESVHGETCSECGMYESHCGCPEEKQSVLEADDKVSPEARKDVEALVAEFKDIPGDYEPTLLQGVAHYLTDSGIYADGFSTEDRKWVDENLSDLLDDGDETDEWNEAALDADLDVNHVVNTLTDISNRTGADMETLASLAAEMEEEMSNKNKTQPVKENSELSSMLRHAGISTVKTNSMAMQVDTIVEGIKNTKSILNEGAISEGLAEASYSAKSARAGKDIGKPGKNFAKISKDAAERYGSKAAGERVAGAVLAKLREDDIENVDATSPEGSNTPLSEREFKTHKGGTVTKTKTGLMHIGRGDDDEDDEDEDSDKKDKKDSAEKKGRGRPKKDDKEKTSAHLPWGGKPPKAKDFPLPKHKGRHWGKKNGEKFDKIVKESMEVAEAMLDRQPSYPEWKRSMREAHPGVTFKGNADGCEAVVEGQVMERFASQAQARLMHATAGGADTGVSPSVAKEFIKKSHGQRVGDLPEKVKEDLDEGVAANVAAGIAALALAFGISTYQAKQIYNSSPQLQTLIQMHQEAVNSGNAAKADSIQKRIEQQKARLDLGQGEVMGKNGQPVDPRAQPEPVQEDDMEEGNEFSGALAKAKAAGAKDFEVDGKTYPVKEGAESAEDILSRIKELVGGAVAKAPAKKEVEEDKHDKEHCDVCDHPADECECEDDESKEHSKKGSKPDFLDVDKDGDKSESMKDAAEDKEDGNEEEVKESEGESKSSGGLYGKGVYESIEAQYNKLMQESMNISMNQSTDGPASLTVTATDEDAGVLAAILKNAGLGGAQPEQVYHMVGAEQVEEDLANAPDEQVSTVDDQVNGLSGGLNGPKLQYAKGYAGDNDIKALHESLSRQYKSKK